MFILRTVAMDIGHFWRDMLKKALYIQYFWKIPQFVDVCNIKSWF